MTEMPVFLLHAVSPSKGFTGVRWLGPNPQSRENLGCDCPDTLRGMTRGLRARGAPRLPAQWEKTFPTPVVGRSSLQSGEGDSGMEGRTLT